MRLEWSLEGGGGCWSRSEGRNWLLRKEVLKGSVADEGNERVRGEGVWPLRVEGNVAGKMQSGHWLVGREGRVDGEDGRRAKRLMRREGGCGKCSW